MLGRYKDFDNFSKCKVICNINVNDIWLNKGKRVVFCIDKYIKLFIANQATKIQAYYKINSKILVSI